MKMIDEGKYDEVSSYDNASDYLVILDCGKIEG